MYSRPQGRKRSKIRCSLRSDKYVFFAFIPSFLELALYVLVFAGFNFKGIKIGLKT